MFKITRSNRPSNFGCFTFSTSAVLYVGTAGSCVMLSGFTENESESHLLCLNMAVAVLGTESGALTWLDTLCLPGLKFPILIFLCQPLRIGFK